MKQYKLLLNWGEFKKDAIIDNLEEEVAATLIKNSIAVPYDAEKEAAQKEAAKEMEKALDSIESLVTKKFADVLSQADEKFKGVIVGKDRIEDDPMGGFKTKGQFLQDVHSACGAGHEETETLKTWRGVSKTTLIEGDDSQGGYLVPTEIGKTWLPPALEKSIAMSRATVIPMKTNRITIPTMVDNDHSTNFFGGVTIYRPGEAAQKTQSKPHFASMELNVHKLVVLCAASDELIEDSPQSIETLLNTNVPAAIAFQADADFINGTGVGMPIGVLNAANPALEAVTAELGQVADTIVWRNILSMYQSFFPVNENAVTWLANRDTFKELATMGLPIGTGGVPVWMPADGSVGRPHNTLMGYPVIFTEKCATLGDQGDIALVDWSQYYIGDKGGVKTASSMHLWFDYDLQAFRFVLRNDGRPAWNSALTPYLGANDLSPFVVLAAR